MTNPVLVEVTRGSRVESRHRGAIAVVDADSKRHTAIGDVDQAVFPRSAVKALQALPLVESGAADRYGFGPAELAVACGSHSGEPRHTGTVANMLAAAGRGEADLACGTHFPLSRDAANALVRAGTSPTPLHNNCSGKHAGFICVACHRGIDPNGYVEPGHPVQREVAATLQALTGVSHGHDVCAADGCSVPTWAAPLDRLALAFARFATGEGMEASRAAAARRLLEACMREPHMVAGTGRFCTDAMALFAGRLFVKGGAEGVYCAAFPELGLGVALKCDDGAGRASETMMAAVINAFQPADESDQSRFADRFAWPITSRGGVKVGEIRPVAGLAATLRG